jgi:hypothetical protein
MASRGVNLLTGNIGYITQKIPQIKKKMLVIPTP